MCKTKWFLDFEEACAHEKVCKGVADRKANVDAGRSGQDISKPAERARREVIEIADSTDSDGSPVITKPSRGKVKRVSKDSVVTPAAADSDGSPLSTKPTRSKSKRVQNNSVDTSTDADSDDSPLNMKSDRCRRSKRVHKDSLDNATASTFEGKAAKKSNKKATASIFNPKVKKLKSSNKKETHQASQASHKKNKAAETADSTTGKRTKREATRSKTKSNLSQQVLAEHNAASFFAKRKQAQMEERERQRKREEARRSVKKKTEEETCKVSEKQDGEDIGVRFPICSHVVQGEEIDGLGSDIMNDKKSSRALNYPHGKVDFNASAEEQPMPNLVFFGDDMPEDVTPNIHHLFSSVFEPAKSKKGKDNDTAAKLWTDKHTISQIPSSILGISNQQSASKLIQFIEEWKIRRHKSTLVKKSKSKRRKSGYDSDDSFLDEDGGGRTSLFLLTGPTGSGKSRLVHAISTSLGCAIMEINSSEIRGGGMLKKRVLESTQSHSSVAMMKKREQTLGILGKPVAKEKEFFDEESESSDEEEESSSLTVILIDEGE